MVARIERIAMFDAFKWIRRVAGLAYFKLLTRKDRNFVLALYACIIGGL